MTKSTDLASEFFIRMKHKVNFQTFLGRKLFVALGANDAAVVGVVVVQVRHELGDPARRLPATAAHPVTHLAPGRPARLERSHGVTRRLVNAIDVTPEVVLEVVATREDFRTQDAVRSLLRLESVLMVLPEMRDAGSEALALDEAEVASENRFSAPVPRGRVGAGRGSEPAIERTIF